MRWEIKQKVKKFQKNNPQVGDIKEKVNFAFLPKRIDNYIIWLENYISICEYNEYQLEFNTDIQKEYVTCYGWVEKERKLLKK